MINKKLIKYAIVKGLMTSYAVIGVTLFSGILIKDFNIYVARIFFIIGLVCIFDDVFANELKYN